MKHTSRLVDPLLFGLALLATALGLVFIFDAGYARSLGMDRGAIPTEFRSQIILLIPSILVGWGASQVPSALWLKASRVLWIVSLLSLIAVKYVGREMNGATRWIDLKLFMLQPAEFVKLTTVIYLAATFAQRSPWPTNLAPRKDCEHWLTSIVFPKLVRAAPALWVLFAVILVEAEPDLGTGAIIAVIAFAMFFPGGVTAKSIVAAVVLASAGGLFLVKQQPYRMERIENHQRRWDEKNVDDTSFQTVQSELAMATGGVFGVGIGNGRAKHILPATTTDFVMATVAEETGLVGAILVLAVLGGISARMLWQAGRAPTVFGSLVLYGVAAWIGIQSCVNFMMANAFLPAIGIPLPFISSGGSSLIALWLAIGVCQSAMLAAKESPEKGPEKGLSKAVVTDPRIAARSARTAQRSRTR